MQHKINSSAHNTVFRPRFFSPGRVSFEMRRPGWGNAWLQDSMEAWIDMQACTVMLQDVALDKLVENDVDVLLMGVPGCLMHRCSGLLIGQFRDMGCYS